MLIGGIMTTTSRMFEEAPRGVQTTAFRPVEEAPRGVQTKVLLKTRAGLVWTGIIFDDGLPGIYDFCCDRYIRRDSWFGLVGWMRIPE
jgi:hypothetical protein